jgi:hypothetical protein
MLASAVAIACGNVIQTSLDRLLSSRHHFDYTGQRTCNLQRGATADFKAARKAQRKT